MDQNQRRALLTLLGLVALFFGWRASSWQACRSACAEDCAAFAQATSPFGGRNDLGRSLCEEGVRQCQSQCRFP